MNKLIEAIEEIIERERLGNYANCLEMSTKLKGVVSRFNRQEHGLLGELLNCVKANQGLSYRDIMEILERNPIVESVSLEKGIRISDCKYSKYYGCASQYGPVDQVICHADFEKQNKTI